MARILDLIPPLYRSEGNELAGFLSALEPEIDAFEKKIGGIASLVDVDKCPEEYLPYLAALTNAPLIGDDPRLWRRQIRNWPWLLKYKGTEKSLALFLNSVGAEGYALHTWFRDAEGNFVEEKPEGEPFYDDATGLWRNARTHYFSVDMVVEGRLIEYRIWSPEEIKERILSWLETAKPFHAELLKLTINMPSRRVDLGPLHIGAAVVSSLNQKVLPDAPEAKPAALIIGGAALLRGEGTLRLPLPAPGAARAGAGMGVSVAALVRVGRPGGPRPFMETWPRHMKSGIASFRGGRALVGPSAPRGGGTLRAGAATCTVSHITLTQEAIS
ncbi:MAG: hypothetical protein LBL73_06790 [Synergistaceae bacterium]|jgi:hypothetical protein|nr:hypothetical protein [Synergistaceae bacterium]